MPLAAVKIRRLRRCVRRSSATWARRDSVCSPGVDLCVDFDPRVVWNHLVRNRDSLVDGDALLDDSIMLHAAAASHRQHTSSFSPRPLFPPDSPGFRTRAPKLSAPRITEKIDNLLRHGQHTVDLGDTQPMEDLQRQPHQYFRTRE